MICTKHIVLLSLSLFLTFSPHAAIDTLDTLGFGISGYDGKFDRNHLRSRVLDLGQLTETNGFQIREKVDALFIDSLNRESHIEEGFDEFTTSLKTSISIGGKFAGFKANVAARYSSDSTTRDDYYFSRKAVVIERAQLRINMHTSNLLRSLVIPHVRDFIETAAPFSIFQSYGTHVTTRLIAGGMLELWSSSKKSRFSSKTEFSSSVSASYKKLVEGSAELTLTESRLAERVETREGLIIHGGALHIGRTGEDDWVLSTKTNSQTIKFLPGGAVPIWELIEDADQAERVRDYFEIIFGGNSLILKRFASTDVHSAHRQAHPETQIYVERGWKVISGGADVRYYGYGQLLTKSYPIISGGIPIGWKVASKDHLKSDPGRIQAFAIAVWDPLNAFDVIVRTSTSSTRPHPYASATIPSGYTLIGGGADVKSREPGNMLVANYPSSSRTWHASSKDHLHSAPSSLVTYAIGIKHNEGAYIPTRRIDARFGPAQHPHGVLRATKGYGFLGAGAQVSKGGLGNMLVRIVPSKDGSEINAYAKDHLEPDRQRLTIYGIEMFGVTFVRDTRSVAGLDPNSL